MARALGIEDPRKLSRVDRMIANATTSAHVLSKIATHFPELFA